jgi:hypothetical protein
MRLGVIFILSIFFLVSCSIPEEPDVDPPVIALVYPASGQEISGVVPVSIIAGDNKGIDRVEFYADGNLIKTWTERPFTFQWNVQSLADGKLHYIGAAAYDKSDNASVTPVIEVRISPATNPVTDSLPPAIQLVYPLDGSALLDITNFLFTATDNMGVERVEFYQDGLLIDTKSIPPYAFALDATNLAVGSAHTFFGIAYDSAGNSSVSNTVTLTRINPSVDNIPPVASILYPLDGSEVDGQVHFVVEARDENGVAKTELLMDGFVVATDTIQPFEFDWDATQVNYDETHVFLVKATDNAGNVGFSTTVSLTRKVNPNTTTDTSPPVVTILSPVEGSDVSGIVPVRVDVLENDVVDRVEFYIDGELKLTDTTSPWEYLLDTSGYASGSSHTIYVKAFDRTGNVGTAFQIFTVL